MVNEEWGPWIEHDGNYVPHLVGLWVRTVAEWPDGKLTERELRVGNGMGASWNWANFGPFTRVLRYRIRKPRGLTILEQIAADPQPVEPELAQ